MTDQNSLELKVQHDGNGVYFWVDSPGKHPNLWLIVEKFSNLDSRSDSFRRFGTPISWMESSHIHHPTTSLRIWRCYNHHTWKLSSTTFLAPTDPGLYFSATFHSKSTQPPPKKTKKHWRHPSISKISACKSSPWFFPDLFFCRKFPLAWLWFSIPSFFRCVLQIWHMSRLRLWIQKLRPPQSRPWLVDKKLTNLTHQKKNLRKNGRYTVVI